MLGRKPLESTPIFAVAGLTAIVVSTGFYWFAERFMKPATPATAAYYTWVAYLYFFAIIFCMAVIMLDFRRLSKARGQSIRQAGVASLKPGWLIPYVLSQEKYAKIFSFTAIAYGLFYAVITSMVVYQPSVDFVQAYGATFPSAIVATCCGSPFYVPVVTVYLVNHLGFLFIPLTVILLFAVATLVGLNLALVSFAYDNRAQGVGRGWLGGLGAMIGLFTGCPTCAGLFFANFLGGSGAVTFATLLGYYQPVFILLSLPILAVTPYLVSRSLSKVFRNGCVVVPHMS